MMLLCPKYLCPSVSLSLDREEHSLFPLFVTWERDSWSLFLGMLADADVPSLVGSWPWSNDWLTLRLALCLQPRGPPHVVSP